MQKVESWGLNIFGIAVSKIKPVIFAILVCGPLKVASAEAGFCDWAY